MAQFDVYENSNPETCRVFPYLLDVQADLLASLPTHVVVPLVDTSALSKAAPILNPQMDIKGTKTTMVTTQIAGIPVHALGSKVCSLKKHRSEILAALDFLFVGY
jgi:toxin CcdB